MVLDLGCYEDTQTWLPNSPYYHWKHFQDDKDEEGGMWLWGSGKLPILAKINLWPQLHHRISWYRRRTWFNSARSWKNSLNLIFTYLLILTLIEANRSIPKVTYQRFQGRGKKGRYIAFELWEIYITLHYFFYCFLTHSYELPHVQNKTSFRIISRPMMVIQTDYQRPIEANC